MLRMAIYIDAPTVPNSDTQIRAAFIYRTSQYTPGNITKNGTILYNLYSRAFDQLKDQDGNVIDPMVFLNNFDQYEFVSNNISNALGELDTNRKIDSLDESVPLAFIRANKVSNFGVL